ncbi:DUF1801 domain-containing protein [Solibacillus sp. CAU 1738]|uniref:DUF1801 domain-containing protein n=1 Tax=Solibacillus sp. CAU 1738 TaxID=3140363 RepID=UPI003261260D
MIETYIEQMEDKWRDAYISLVETVDANLPEGFEKTDQYNMLNYVVPLSTYPPGYHCTPNTPLPFLAIAAQKRHLAIYHMGIYADPQLLAWFEKEYAKRVPTKLNMGKSCIRFTSTKHIPFDLIAELVQKMTPERWVQLYEQNVKR